MDDPDGYSDKMHRDICHIPIILLSAKSSGWSYQWIRAKVLMIMIKPFSSTLFEGRLYSH